MDDSTRARIFLCDLTYTQQTIASDVMPAAVGGIASYLLQEIPGVNVKLFKYPERLISVLESLNPESAPHLSAFPITSGTAVCHWALRKLSRPVSHQ